MSLSRLPEVKALETAFQRLENQLKIILSFLVYYGTCLISLISLPIKADVFAAEEVQQRQ